MGMSVSVNATFALDNTTDHRHRSRHHLQRCGSAVARLFHTRTRAFFALHSHLLRVNGLSPIAQTCFELIYA